MEDEKIIQNEEPNVVEDKDVDYLQAIRQLKETTVSKDEYNKLMQEKKELLQAYIDNRDIDLPSVKGEEDESITELRDELYGGKSKLNNLDYWKKTLELRKKLIDSGEGDPFIPSLGDVTPEMYATADRVATTMQDMVDYADGDNQVFTDTYQREIKDPVMVRRK